MRLVPGCRLSGGSAGVMGGSVRALRARIAIAPAAFQALFCGVFNLRPLDGVGPSSVDADHALSGDGGATHRAVLAVIVIDRIVLGRLVVPDRDVVRPPAPAHSVLQ